MPRSLDACWSSRTSSTTGTRDGCFAYAPYAREIDIWADLFPQVVVAAPCRTAAPPGEAAAFSRPNVDDRAAAREPAATTLGAKLGLVAQLPAIVMALARSHEGTRTRSTCAAPATSAWSVPCWRRCSRVISSPSTPGSGTTPRAKRGRCDCSGRSSARAGGVVRSRSTATGRASPTRHAVLHVGARTRHISRREPSRRRTTPPRRPRRPVRRPTVAVEERRRPARGARGHPRAGLSYRAIRCRGRPGARRPRGARRGTPGSATSDVLPVRSPSTASWTRTTKSSILVLASDTEGWPKAITEAMAFGLVCIGSACGLVPSILQDGRGIVVPPRDPAALAAVLCRVLAEPVDCATMREHAAAWGQQYSLDTLRRELSRLLASHWGSAFQSRLQPDSSLEKSAS